ncbi:hypothetical protein J9E33_001924 [Salmonella enterica]|nr:hypothetical protein [Salmonella enterica]EFO5892364.1 hypothetical protein [Salmonella enterica]EFO8527530.1 hypothetical protein [Salmonella enterica]EFR2316677.1 hypothetical protein [Salmonella enterica]EFR3850082.1 hypothetical protein [Salmonella enterica]
MGNKWRVNQLVFPAPAGINRPYNHHRVQLESVPRASGDKPTQIAARIDANECSPRQRG